MLANVGHGVPALYNVVQYYRMQTWSSTSNHKENSLNGSSSNTLLYVTDLVDNNHILIILMNNAHYRPLSHTCYPYQSTNSYDYSNVIDVFSRAI